jgi:hypothetical protein
MPIMTAPERAAQIWGILALAARNRQILTYKMVGKLIGVPAQGLPNLLDPVHEYCVLRKLPPLTILVVREDTGLPGSGFRAASAKEYAKGQLDVFDFDWISHGAPTPGELEKAVKAKPSATAR